MKKLAMILFTAAVALSSCSKDDDDNNNNPSGPVINTANLTVKPWKATGLTIGGADFWSIAEECEKDNIYTFKTDNTYIEDEGATKCDSGDPQIIVTSTWSLINNNTRLVYDGDTATIKELSSTKMVLESQVLGNTATATFAPE